MDHVLKIWIWIHLIIIISSQRSSTICWFQFFNHSFKSRIRESPEGGKHTLRPVFLFRCDDLLWDLLLFLTWKSHNYNHSHISVSTVIGPLKPFRDPADELNNSWYLFPSFLGSLHVGHTNRFPRTKQSIHCLWTRLANLMFHIYSLISILYTVRAVSSNWPLMEPIGKRVTYNDHTMIPGCGVQLLFAWRSRVSRLSQPRRAWAGRKGLTKARRCSGEC